MSNPLTKNYIERKEIVEEIEEKIKMYGNSYTVEDAWRAVNSRQDSLGKGVLLGCQQVIDIIKKYEDPFTKQIK